MIALFVFLVILSILIMVHEFGHFIAAKRLKVRVEQFSLGFGPVLFKKKKKGTEYCLSAIPLGGFVKMAGDNLEEYKGNLDEYYSRKPGERFLIIFSGPLLNYLLGFLFFWLIFFSGYPTLTTKVGGLIDGFGAKEAGLESGDTITAVNGERIAYWEDLQKIIQEKKASSVRLAVLRNNQQLFLEARIREQEVDDLFGSKRFIGLLGITPSDEVVRVRHGFFSSFFLAADKTLDLTAMTGKGLWRVITGRLSMRESVTGPLGIFYITSKAAKLGLTALLHLVAVLSISLAIFNLLPLPILDGGHILFLAIEKIRGKGLGLKAERIITRIGLTLIVSLAIFVTYNDILRLFGDKLSKFFK